MKNIRFLFVLVVLLAMQVQIMNRRPPAPVPTGEPVALHVEPVDYSPALRSSRQITVPNMGNVNGLGYIGCSSTVIDTQALLTATHCFVDEKPAVGTVFMVNGHLYTIEKFANDGNDHTIVVLTGTPFPASDIASVGNNVELSITDEVYMLGNPGGMRNMFRRGYIAGFSRNSEGLWVHADFRATGGDSGSGIFNADGKIIGVLERVGGPGKVEFANFRAFNFTNQQLTELGINVNR